MQDLESLVGDWVTVPDLVERWGSTPSRVRQMIKDRDLISSRIGERAVLAVPSIFITDEGPLPSLRGTILVMADGGFSDEEILRWLFTPDETLPGTPAEKLAAGHKAEIRKRAQEMAW